MKLRWTKRLKWLRVSKIIIPLALAISLVFVGFSVYADNAQNFIVRIDGEDEVKLSLTLERDLSNQVSVLNIPFEGSQTAATFVPPTKDSNDANYDVCNIPDDIALYDKVTYGRNNANEITFSACSFYLVNNSNRAVDVDIKMHIDGIMTNGNNAGIHIDDTVRIMLIEGEPLLSDETYTVYSKPERTQENKDFLISHAPYSENTVDFVTDTCVLERSGDNAIKSLGAGKSVKFTIVFWLEGWDVECTDEIRGEMLKFSIDFTGR
ncbi:MAG: hypothetical protein ACI4MH_02830 [Candidatus Coproplasma sp.]